jgi:catechol 2,3-dioxygenase-like lactoylglutathione lyase family enzyme
MLIHVSSIFVNDQDKALEFYTQTLGFLKKKDVPVGDFRSITVVSPERPEGCELLLEPNAHPAARQYQKAIAADGIPATSFGVADLHAEYERLRDLGVEFTRPPSGNKKPVTAIFNDSCGNLIEIATLEG